MATKYKTIRVSNGKPPKGAEYVSPGVYRVPVSSAAITTSGGSSSSSSKATTSGGSVAIGRGNETDPNTLAADEEHARQEAQRFYATGSLGRAATPERLAEVAAAPQIGMIDSSIDANSQQSIDENQSAYNAAMQDNPYVTAALQAGQSSLAGFSGPEYQAMLEKATRGVNSNQASAMRALKGFQGANGINGTSGGTQAYGLLRDANIQRQQATSNVLAQSAQDLTQRIANYGALSNNAYNSYASVRSNALSNLTGARNYATNRTDNINVQNQGAQGTNAANTIGVNSKNAEIGKYNIDNAYNQALFNIGQGEKEIAGQSGSYYGDMASSVARRNQDKQNKIAEEAAKAAKRGY